MNTRTLARRLERLETKLNPTDKPGITVIVDGAGEEKIFHLPDFGGFRTERQKVSERIMQDCNQNHDGDV
jgi:hypothetical protein